MGSVLVMSACAWMMPNKQRKGLIGIASEAGERESYMSHGGAVISVP